MIIRILSLLFFSIWLCNAKAQNGVLVGPTSGSAHASAMLEVNSTSKGFLLPRVNLVALNNGTSPVNGPAPGLLVYNLGAGGVPAVGVYYWDGSANAWVQLTAGGMSGTGTTNYVTKWTASTTLGNSQIYDNATNVAIGTTTPLAKLDVRGAATITTGSNYGNTNNHLLAGSLAIGGSDVNFGGGTSWNTNTAGLLLECLDNTEIGIHDAGTRIASALYFQGATTNLFTIGRDMGWGKTDFAVAMLTGTGHRQVYASPNGTLTTNFPTAVVYSYTGANQTYTVPASGVTSLTIKMWGAGGGGGFYGGWNCGFSGGAGGYTQGVLAVTPGQVLTIIVGGGGVGGNVTNTAASYGGGAAGCPGNSDCRYGGQGGGRSAIRNAASVELMTAGGGGGGGSSAQAPGNTLYEYGGAGGGLVGQDGLMAQYYYGGGQGGAQTIGGYGAKNMSNANGSNGSQYTGGAAGQNSYGGGGGGGWYGGGGGGYMGVGSMGGGGGGSGYIAGAGVSNAFTLRGNYTEPPKIDDINYVSGIGVGGYSNSTLTPSQGGHGRVVIIPNP